MKIVVHFNFLYYRRLFLKLAHIWQVIVMLAYCVVNQDLKSSGANELRLIIISDNKSIDFELIIKSK